MMVTEPKVLTGAALVSTTATLDDPAAWSNLTDYAIGARCRVDAVHMVYQSKVNPNLDHDPVADVGDDEDGVGEFWVAVWPTNPYRMYDEAIQSQTTAEDELVVVHACEGINDNAYCFNVDAAEVRFVVEDADEGVVYDETFDMTDNDGVEDEYDYFFKMPRRKRSLAVEGLPPYADPQITVTFSAPGETVGCGGLKIGQGIAIGLTQWGMKYGIRDYSKRKENDFGDVKVAKRAWALKKGANVWVQPDMVDYVVEQLAEYRATAVVWSGDPRYAPVYGFFDDLTVDVAYAKMSAASLSIMGLI